MSDSVVPRSGRRPLLRWAGWFAAANALIYGLIGFRYLLLYPFVPDALGVAYVVLAYIGQFALLASLPVLLVVVPLALLVGRRLPVMAAAVVLASLGGCALILDTQVFAQNRFHLTALSVALFEWPTWVFAGIMLVILLAFESMLAGMVWRGFANYPGSRRGGWVALALVGAWTGGTLIHIWGDAVGHTPVTQFTRYMPLYYPIHAKRDLARLGLVDAEQVEQRRLLERADAGGSQLRYPLEPLRCAPPAPPLNLMVILIDALRPDVIDPDLTPQLEAWRGRSLAFNQHYSGGNSSRMGIFSMFYGLPSTYWQAFNDLQQPPVLMEQLRRAGYFLTVHSAIGFGSPTLIDRTVFAGVPDLPTGGQGGSATQDNIAVTDGWLEWSAARDAESDPFFAFLYYDPPMDDMPRSGDQLLPLEDRVAAGPEAVTRWHQYRLAARLVDREVGRVLADLDTRGLTDRTVVIVASDHGYEFDDNGLGYVGHAGNFSAAQLRATLMVAWPGRAPAVIDYRTSHHDLPVTLMQDLLGCDNAPADYSIGRGLFTGKSWDWIIAGSYTDHAIVQPDRTIVTYPGGFVEVLGPDYRPLSGAGLDRGLIADSMAAMRRFYR